MATTAFATGDALAVKLWSRKMAVEALKQTWAYKFMGKDDNSVIQIFDETTKSEGDRIRIPLRRLLVGAGVSGDNTLEGNEERMNYYSDDIFINQLRWGVREGGKFTRQLVPFDIRENARSALQDWWADRFDAWFFNQICSNVAQTDVRYAGMQAVIQADTNHIVIAGGSTTTGSLSAGGTSSVFTLALIDTCVERAKTLDIPIRPIMMNGEEKYVMFLHPYQVTDLRINTNTGQWLDIQKAAMTGGNVSKNPIYTGALGEYNGVILHSSVRVPLAVSGSSTTAITNTRAAAFCGAQAAGLAFGRDNGPERFNWVEDFFDYDNQFGVAAGAIAGLKKLVFNSADFATIQVNTWAAAH